MKEILQHLSDGNFEDAANVASKRFPFAPVRNIKRSYSDSDMLKIFLRDGFIDRYSGEQLLNPGVLRLLNDLLPEEFPFHPHGKMDSCHEIYWTRLPSIDHLVPVSRGGKDDESNWVTTSMKRNLVKNLWLLDELGWNLCDPGSLNDWDGASQQFINIVEKFQDKCCSYTLRWYRITKKLLSFDKPKS